MGVYFDATTLMVKQYVGAPGVRNRKQNHIGFTPCERLHGRSPQIRPCSQHQLSFALRSLRSYSVGVTEFISEEYNKSRRLDNERQLFSASLHCNFQRAYQKPIPNALSY
jgi:hypothetical protein